MNPSGSEFAAEQRPQFFETKFRRIAGGGGGNRTHVRGTSIAGFSVCSRLLNLARRSVSWRPSTRASPKNLGHRLRASRRPSPSNIVHPRPTGRVKGRTWLPKQPVRSYCRQLKVPTPVLRADGPRHAAGDRNVPRQTQYAPRFGSLGDFSIVQVFFSPGSCGGCPVKKREKG